MEPESVQITAPVPFTAGCVLTPQAERPGASDPQDALVNTVYAGVASWITIDDNGVEAAFVYVIV